jgi:alpha-L-arabinofuranosidase
MGRGKATPFPRSNTEMLFRVAFALLTFSVAVSFASIATAQPAAAKPQATLTIDTAAPSKPYSPMIFGGFLEHFDHQIYGGVFEPGSPLSDKKGFRRDVLAALKELKCPVVRWPGGCYASGYHWEAGVGKNRRPTDDMAWGVVEPNTFGTDEFVELCRLLEWQPYICNNAGNGTIEEMKDWVEYCNAREGPYARMRKESGYAKPRNVNLWSIGNENWGAHEIGYKPIEQWAPLVLAAAKAMKAADPHIQLTAAALPTREWSLPLLKLAGPYLDYISIHSYWLALWGKNDMPDYLTCIMHSESPEQLIANYIGVLQESGYRSRIKIAFDEWNLRGWHHEGFPRKQVQDYNSPEVIRLVAAREKNHIASQYTLADALFSASFLNACLRHAEDVGMANIAPLVNTRGPLYVHPQGIVKRTHFHTLAMYANELEKRVGRLDIKADPLAHNGKSVPVVDAIATVNDSGKHWAIALVNRHPEKPVACTIKMKDRPLQGSYQALVLTGDSPDAYNDIQNPNRVVPQRIRLSFANGIGDLPPHSLTIIKVSVLQRTPETAVK